MSDVRWRRHGEPKNHLRPQRARIVAIEARPRSTAPRPPSSRPRQSRSDQNVPLGEIIADFSCGRTSRAGVRPVYASRFGGRPSSSSASNSASMPACASSTSSVAAGFDAACLIAASFCRDRLVRVLVVFVTVIAFVVVIFPGPAHPSFSSDQYTLESPAECQWLRSKSSRSPLVRLGASAPITAHGHQPVHDLILGFALVF